jgi:Flp pilus assembly protein TadG
MAIDQRRLAVLAGRAHLRIPFSRDERGVTAVEFALIAPVFLALLMGAIEYGLIFFTYNSATHAAWDVTRQLATNQITTSQVSSAAIAELPSWVRANTSVSQVSSSTDPNANHYTVVISFPATAATPTNVMSWAYGSLTLKASSTMQQEPTS